ncbi:MAG: hypothetical protein WKG00_31620 [Polyangiaceae bacterium]
MTPPTATRWRAAPGSCLLALLCLSLAGCGAEPVPAPIGVRMQVAADGSAPAYGEAPFPSDAVRDADGHLERIAGLEAVVPRGVEVFLDHLTTLDGFGLRPTVEFFLSSDPGTDPAPLRSLDATAAALLVDVDPASPERGRVLPSEWRWNGARRVLAGAPEPGVVLREGTRYAALLRAGPAAGAGTLVASADLRALAAADPSTVPWRWRSTVEGLRELGRLGVASGDDLAGIAVFTTQHASRALLAARGRVDDRGHVPEPVLSFPDPSFVFRGETALRALLGDPVRDESGEERWGWSNPGHRARSRGRGGHRHPDAGALHHRSCRRRASLERLLLDADGVPAVTVPAEAVAVTLVLPSVPPPTEAGFPVAIFGHGLGASRHAVLTFAEPLAREGFAVVAIDFRDFGSHFSAEDTENNLAGVLDDFGGDAALRDGFADTTGPPTLLAFLRGFVNLSGVRDSVRQSALDLGQLVRALQQPGLDLSALAAPGAVAPRLDARRPAYLGESYGSLVGAVFAAIEPDVDLFVLDVPGGGILDLEIASSPGIGSLLIPLVRAVYALDGELDRYHPMMALAQALLDPADPLTYAPHVLHDRFQVAGAELGPRHLLAIEVAGDELIPQIGTHALARAMGLPLLAPHLGLPPALAEVASPASANVDGQSAALVQYAPATHGANWTSETGTLSFVPGCPCPGDDPFPRLPAPIEIANPMRETLAQVVIALRTHQQAPAPIFQSTLAPVADFDGDGTTDAEELAAGGDPLDPAQ